MTERSQYSILKRRVEGLENAIAMQHDWGYYDPGQDFRWKSLLWYMDSCAYWRLHGIACP